MLINFLTSFIASAMVMKRSMDWHKRVLYLSIPLFLLFMLVQTGYIIYRLRSTQFEGH
ncbi:hypothetical protein [Bacillus sp. FJAT-52991]|uniref:Uncharacterized protein n=1 Tax=Bacillus kandeliae TaxID=3129297 RepID=A0ABZ2N749_9BACI